MENNLKGNCMSQVENITPVKDNKISNEDTLAIYASDLNSKCNRLLEQIQVIEKDRDDTKQLVMHLTCACMEILSLDDIEEIRKKIKATIHTCATEALDNAKQCGTTITL